VGLKAGSLVSTTVLFEIHAKLRCPKDFKEAPYVDIGIVIGLT
jgi:hypothetical protein